MSDISGPILTGYGLDYWKLATAKFNALFNGLQCKFKALKSFNWKLEDKCALILFHKKWRKKNIFPIFLNIIQK